MTQDATDQQQTEHLAIANGQSSALLGECVKEAVLSYFQQMDGHEIQGLYGFVLEEIEKPLLETVMQQLRGNQSKAAKALTMSRSTLRKKLAKYDLD